ncbi:MAG: hypothetical protein M3Y87_35725, partial [Myxococcota bacterium]|nr:hypothetical protein [Myxococcota bacterium]
MRISLSLAALALAWIALPVSGARADMIHIPHCPAGFEGRRVGHGGQCFPISCSSDAACGEGLRCARVSRCWREQRISSGRRAPQPGERPPTAWIAGALCDDEHTCR